MFFFLPAFATRHMMCDACDCICMSMRQGYTAGISQYNSIQLAILQDMIGQMFATELDYIVKCPQ